MRILILKSIIFVCKVSSCIVIQISIFLKCFYPDLYVVATRTLLNCSATYSPMTVKIDSMKWQGSSILLLRSAHVSLAHISPAMDVEFGWPSFVKDF